MSAKIDPALLAKLNTGPRSFNVEIEFSELPPPGDAEAMGMRQEGKLVWGVLDREKIEALATVPQVIAIRLSRRPVEPRAVTPRDSRIGPNLQIAMQDNERDLFHVYVSFRRPQKSAPQIGGLSVHLDTGHGHLTRQAIAKLAENDEVAQIELAPEVQLFKR